MAICIECGREFDLSTAKRIIGRRYGAGTYDQYYPNGNECESCATLQISADVGTGEELEELRGEHWDD